MPSTSIARGVSCVLRVAAVALVVLTCFLLLPVSELRPLQIDLGLAVTGLEPGWLSGALVFVTQAGTALRGDFLLCAVALLLIDWLVGRACTARMR